MLETAKSQSAEAMKELQRNHLNAKNGDHPVHHAPAARRPHTAHQKLITLKIYVATSN